MATALPQARTIAYLVQTRNAVGEWNDIAEFELVKSRSVQTVAEGILHTRSTEHPGRQWRVMAWDVVTVERVTGCDPYPEHGYPSTQFSWLSAMRENVQPHADVTAPTGA